MTSPDLQGSSAKEATLRVLVTGSNGFIGRNLIDHLGRSTGTDILSFDQDASAEEVSALVAQADIVYHLAGVNRPESIEEFQTENVDLTAEICELLLHGGRCVPVVFSSSTQADTENPYGKSKRDAEAVLERYAQDSGASVVVLRLSNVFGKWCRPNYNSVVATFCYNIARDIPIRVDEPDRDLDLVYIDDVVSAFVEVGAQLGLLPPGGKGAVADLEVPRPAAAGAPEKSATTIRYCEAVPIRTVTLAELASLLQAFRESRSSLWIPDFGEPLNRALYATYLSYLEREDFAYGLTTHTDPRGSLAEFLKSPGAGQIFVSRTKPGVTRGNHYHSTKTEKFLVLEGSAVVRFRHVGGGDVIEYPVSGDEFRVVDIPPGYTHSIENVGSTELITLFWASEIFDPERPDTVGMEV